MIRFFTRFVATYGYDSPKEFFLSVAPSFKYNLQFPAISFSAVTAVVSEWIGITPFLAMAMRRHCLRDVDGHPGKQGPGNRIRELPFLTLHHQAVYLADHHLYHPLVLSGEQGRDGRKLCHAAGHPVLLHCQGVRHDLVLRRARDKHTGEPGGY